MTKALALTADGLIRALSAGAGPRLAETLAARAEALAAALDGPGRKTAILRREPGLHAAPVYEVAVSGEGLSAREFGSLAGDAEPVAGPAVAVLGERR